MKSILSFAIGLVALFTVTTGFTPVKDNAHFVSDPCLKGRTIQATIAGLGSGGITVTMSGDFICVNPGGNEPKPKSFELTQNFDKKSGGNFRLSFDLASLCPNRNWTFKVSDLHIVVSTTGDGVVLDQTFPGTLASCK